MEAQALYVGYCIRERRHVRAADSVARQGQGPNVAQVRLVLPAPVDEESLQGWNRQHKYAKSLDFHWIKQCQRISMPNIDLVNLDHLSGNCLLWAAWKTIKQLLSK